MLGLVLWLVLVLGSGLWLGFKVIQPISGEIE